MVQQSISADVLSRSTMTIERRGNYEAMVLSP
jgi:hypothetical protein